MISLPTLLLAVLGSSVLGVMIANSHQIKQHQKELVAGAVESALKRVEMYYRLRRRMPTGSDDATLRDHLHDIQEENDYYSSLIAVESHWLGDSYKLLVSRIKGDLLELMHKAWEADGRGPSARVTDGPDVSSHIDSFIDDSRTYFNPLKRMNRWINNKGDQNATK